MSNTTVVQFYPKIGAPLINITVNELCQLAYSFRQETRILIVNIIITLVTFSNLIVMYLLYRSREMRRMWALITRDLKILVFIGFCFYFSCALNGFIMYVYKTTIQILDLPPCYYVWNGKACYLSQRFYSTSVIRGYGFIHAGLLLERTYVAIVKQHRFDGLFGGITVVLVAATILVPQIFIIDSKMYETSRAYCGDPLTVTSKDLLTVNYFYLFFDIAVSFGDFLLYLKNKREIARHKRNLSNFTLEYSFKLREVQLSIALIYPFSVLHSIMFSIHMSFLIYYQKTVNDSTLKEEVFIYDLTVNLARLVSNLVLMIFLYVYNKCRKSPSVKYVGQLDSADIHFREFQRIIS